MLATRSSDDPIRRYIVAVLSILNVRHGVPTSTVLVPGHANFIESRMSFGKHDYLALA
jgi:hypothetical protein